MAFADRYGIDLSSVYGAVDKSNLAEQAIKLNKMKIAREEGTLKGEYNALLNKDNKSLAVNAKDTDGDGAAETKNTLLKSQTPAGTEAVAVQNTPDSTEAVTTDTEETKEPSYEDMVAKVTETKLRTKLDKQRKQKEAMKMMFKKAGDSDAEAELKANLGIEKVTKFEDYYKKLDDRQKRQAQDGLIKSANELKSFLDVAKDNPQQAEQMYQQKRVSTLETINKLRADGHKNEADKLYNEYRFMPPTLMKNGQFDPTYLNTQLHLNLNMLRDAKDYEKDRDSIRNIDEAKQKQINKNVLTAPQFKEAGGKAYRTDYDEKTGKPITKNIGDATSTKNALLRKSTGTSSGSTPAKTSQYQKDVRGIEKQIATVMSGQNIMNAEDKKDAIKELNNQYISALKAFKRGDPEGYKIQFGDNDPLDGVNLRKKEFAKKKDEVVPSDFYELSEDDQKAWKNFYISTGEKLPIKKGKDGVFGFGSTPAKIDKSAVAGKKVDTKNIPEGVPFREGGKVWIIKDGKKLPARKRVKAEA